MAETGSATPPPAPGSDHARTTPGTLDRGLALVRFLRANCPWDAKQTSESLVRHLLEEAHEVADAVHSGEDGELEGELGDLLLNLAFQVVVAEEADRFTADSVTRRLEEKMRRRHPHLYGDGPREDWETLKAREREEARASEDGARQPSVLDGLSRGLEPLSRAHRMQERVAEVGFDWAEPGGAWEKVAEGVLEVGGARVEGSGEELDEELGELLFSVVTLVRLAGVVPVAALDQANRKFRRRFEGLEGEARRRGIELTGASLEELDALWDTVKAREAADP